MSKLTDALDELQEAVTERNERSDPKPPTLFYADEVAPIPPLDEIPPFAGPCQARQYSDQMCCGRCGLQWDMNDPESPKCSP